MAERIHVLLVDDPKAPLTELERLLDRQGIQTTHARNCAEAAAVLSGSLATDLIFTNTTLPDGTWDEVEALAERMNPPVPVIVVSRNMDITLYLDAMERGVSDLIVPPFQDIDLNYVVRGAVLNRMRSASQRLRGTVKKASEVTQDVENYTRSRVRTFHPQSGGQAKGTLGRRTGTKLE